MTTFYGFYCIFKSIKELDKISIIKEKGFKTIAKVINIIENKITDSDGNLSYRYIYKVKFRDNRGKEIIQDIDYFLSNRDNRNPPFEIEIIYKLNDKDDYNILVKNNKSRNYRFYISFLIGTFLLGNAVFNNNGEFNFIIEYLEKIFK